MIDSDKIISSTGDDPFGEDQNDLGTTLQMEESAGDDFALQQCESGRDSPLSKPPEGFNPLTGAPKNGAVGNFVFLRMMI